MLRVPIEYETISNDINTELFDNVPREVRNVIDCNKNMYESNKKREDTMKNYSGIIERNETIKSMGNVSVLKSDYLGMESYFYNEKINEIYSVDNISGKQRTVGVDVGRHLRELNNITAPINEKPVSPWDGVDKSKLINLNEISGYSKGLSNCL